MAQLLFNSSKSLLSQSFSTCNSTASGKVVLLLNTSMHSGRLLQTVLMYTFFARILLSLLISTSFNLSTRTQCSGGMVQTVVANSSESPESSLHPNIECVERAKYSCSDVSRDGCGVDSALVDEEMLETVRTGPSLGVCECTSSFYSKTPTN